MISISVTDRDGKQKTVTFEPNPSGNLMEILTAEGFDVPAICGGMAGCGTCHIGLIKGGENLEEAEEDEEFMLDSLPNLTDDSRLSCQIPLTEELNGLEIKVLGDGM